MFWGQSLLGVAARRSLVEEMTIDLYLELRALDPENPLLGLAGYNEHTRDLVLGPDFDARYRDPLMTRYPIAYALYRRDLRGAIDQIRAEQAMAVPA